METKKSGRHREFAVKHVTASMFGLTLLLSAQGCAFSEPPHPPPGPSSIAISSTPKATASPADDPCPARFYQSATQVAASPGDLTLDGDPLFAPIDRGSRDRATGSVIIGAEGIAVSYTVAPDDLRENVAERLCLPEYYFDSLNQVRTNVSATLYVGDTLNVNPYTISSVGDQDGVVSTNPLPAPAPPQQ